MIVAVVETAAAMPPMMFRQSEHAVDRAHRAANTRTDGSTDDGADRTRVATTLTGTFLRAPDDTLRMSGMRHRQQGERDRRSREIGF
jgi:hypothetical protein